MKFAFHLVHISEHSANINLIKGHYCFNVIGTRLNQRNIASITSPPTPLSYRCFNRQTQLQGCGTVASYFVNCTRWRPLFCTSRILNGEHTKMKLNYTKRGNSHTLFKHSRTGALPFHSFTIARSTEEYKETSGLSEGFKFAGIDLNLLIKVEKKIPFVFCIIFVFDANLGKNISSVTDTNRLVTLQKTNSLKVFHCLWYLAETLREITND